MKMRNLLFGIAGAGAVLAYQRYKQPIQKNVEKVVKSAKKTTNKLEDMM